MHNVRILISSEEKIVMKTPQTGMCNDNAHLMLHGRKEKRKRDRDADVFVYRLFSLVPI